MHRRESVRHEYKCNVWDALTEIAERHEIDKKGLGDYGIGQLIVGVVLNDDDTSSIFAGRCGWYSAGGERVVTDVTSFIWHDDAMEPAHAVQSYATLWIHAAHPAYACDTDRQARALAALASEAGVLPNIERMIDHER